jgi:hypothetical protein
MRRTQAQWLSLIQEQQRSGLSATTFCKKRGIDPKYFSLRKNQLQIRPCDAAKSGGFVHLPMPAPQPIHLSCGAVHLSLPASYPVDAMAQLMRALR